MKSSAKSLFLVAALVHGVCLTPANEAKAQTVKTLHYFATPTGQLVNPDGTAPQAGLVLSGTTLYGTAFSGGPNSNGTLYAVSTSGTGFKVLHAFSGYSQNGVGASTNSDGAGLFAGLALSGNTLYGVAAYGGSGGVGTIFSLSTSGSNFTTLHSFTGDQDGGNPNGGLVVSGNVLYGTTSSAGPGTAGTVFSVNTDGTGFTNLHNFSGASDGSYPAAALTLTGNTLYGTTSGGGASSQGTIFVVNTDGSGFGNLYSFSAIDNNGANSDGSAPVSQLVLSGSILYGTAAGGGTGSGGTVFSLSTDGTGFTVLHAFSMLEGNGTNLDGFTPKAGLLLSGGTLYGTTAYGGKTVVGTIFSVSATGGGLKTLYNFKGATDGGDPFAPLIMSGGAFYGTAVYGGLDGQGTVFSFGAGAVGPPPKSYLITVEASPPHSGEVSGGGSFQSTESVQVSASNTNECYQFSKWTIGGVTKSTDATFTFLATASETVVAVFTNFEYAIHTVSAPPQGGTVVGSGTKGCGSVVKLTATAKPGFKFTNWVANGVVQGTKPVLTFTADSAATVTANFVDGLAPTVTVASPVSGIRTTNATLIVSGKASDNVAVQAVYYQVNSNGTWTAATTANNWTNWGATVVLSPGANVIEVYAVDTSGNASKPIVVKVTYTAPPGFAPASLVGMAVHVTPMGGVLDLDVSFGTTTFAQVPLDTNDSASVGDYTYTRTGLDTAELGLTDTAPPSREGRSNSVILTFTSASSAAFTTSDGTPGTLTLSEATDFAPASLSGLTVEDHEPLGVLFTNVFATGTFTRTGVSESDAGTYSYTKYSPMAGLITEIFTAPANLVGSTNFIVVEFPQKSAGNYGIESDFNVSGGGPGTSESFGTFTVLSGAP